ncbi:MAG TPA: SgcJ/EcaC family oxidoreductase [Gemmatimonadales bacterium]|nr:SgcJ/EcaC family oxidoreductase [Gemmatimonadales bacterium]
MPRAAILLVALSMLAGVSRASAQVESAVPAEARAAAQAMVDRFVDSWNRADGAAYGKNYWPEAELVDPIGIISRGREAIVQEHVDLWAGPFKGSHIEGKVRRVRMLGPTFMMVDFDAALSGVHDLPPGSAADSAGVVRNHLKHVMERRHGRWKVLAAQNTFIAPLAGGDRH